MAKNTLTLKLQGSVPLAEFAEAMGHFSALVEALTDDVGGTTDVEWEISKLEAGSATAVIIGRSPYEDVIEKVVQAYEIIGSAIKGNKPIPYSENIAKEARSITGLLNGKITAVEFVTDEMISTIDKPLYLMNHCKGNILLGQYLVQWKHCLNVEKCVSYYTIRCLIALLLVI